MTRGHARDRGHDAREDPTALLQERLVEKVAEKLDRTLEQQVAKHERTARKVAQKLEALERAHGVALDLWTRPEPGARKARLSRDEIAAAAVRIADAEGFDALSMRRLATELDAGTMTLYHYVWTKDELLTLVVDAVMGEIVIPPDEPLPDDWREALRAIARHSLAALRRHPWVLDITQDPPAGPNSVRHFDQSLAAVRSLPLALDAKLDVVLAVDEYVFGVALMERNNLGEADEDRVPDHMAALIQEGDYPELARGGLQPAWEAVTKAVRDPGRFERNLDRLLRAIDAEIPGTRSDGGAP